MTEGFLDIFTFHDKTLAVRLDEFKNILSKEGRVVPASRIREEWVCDVELVIEPVGWQALWKISPMTCESFNIHYPTIVLVEAIGMDIPALTATVKILAVQDDIHLPEAHEVPLIELYPTISQTNTKLDIVGTAHCIDRLRFFYNYLWMPWDEEEDDNTDWVEQHLEQRIRLFYDMNNEIINKETCDIIKSLIREGREIQEKIAKTEMNLPDDLQYGVKVPESIEDQTCELVHYHFRLQQIKSEMDLLENPSLRGLIKKKQTSKRKQTFKDKKSIYYFVWQGGTKKEFIEHNNRIQRLVPDNATIRICEYLSDTLDLLEAGEIILLGEGQQSIKRSSGVEEKSMIIGLGDPDKTVLFPTDSNISFSALFDISNTEIFLENICIELGALKAGLVVRKNCVLFVTNCKIRVTNANLSSVKWGAVVNPGAKIVFKNTTFQGLGTAVIVYATGKVNMNNCYFENCKEGIRINENAHLTVNKCSFGDIENKQAIIMESESATSLEVVEVNNSLVKDIHVSECKFNSNDKMRVTVKPKKVFTDHMSTSPIHFTGISNDQTMME
ncbi:protein nessun dorma [Pseudomyrmex gracilis]|uniref:protein nessun dorma n=1 Tax=Pseudomyrmex gracilis TaxID=219809 RepID=UPI000994DC72|nr:protein nessun dorma [Pseudomyrmex gracilis]